MANYTKKNQKNTEAREHERDYVFQQQGLKSFVKIKMDWAKFNKLHFSFVQHSGKPECKQVAKIEAALKIDGADGALLLAESILSGLMGRKRSLSLKEKQEQNQKFAKPVFSSLGGTVSKRAADGICMFRQVTLAPGNNSEYVLQALEAEGEETQTGGITMKQGATATRISVGFSQDELISMASAIKIAWQAYMTCEMLKNSSYSPVQPQSATLNDSKAKEPEPTASVPVSKPVPEKPSTVWVVYDTLGVYFEVAGTAESAVSSVQTAITELRKNYKYQRKDNEDYNMAKEAILNNSDSIPMIVLYSGDKTCQIVVLKKMVR